MAKSNASADNPIKVGVIAEQTGALSFVGIANANVARMAVTTCRTLWFITCGQM